MIKHWLIVAFNVALSITRNSRPVSWSPHSKFLVDVSSSKPGDDKSRVEYHCYSQLSQYLHDPLKSPCPAPITATPSQPSSAPCKRFYSLPGQTKNEDDDAHEEDDDVKDPSKDKCDRSVCPRSKLSQCTCDLELELSGKINLLFLLGFCLLTWLLTILIRINI